MLPIKINTTQNIKHYTHTKDAYYVKRMSKITTEYIWGKES